MKPLITRTPKRLFAFGCSFTEYYWGGTWPEIIAKELNISLYNYGKSGAGNQYISNMVSQADSIFHFTEDDLVMISWTNVCREDKWVDRKWYTPGNIFTQGEYDYQYVKKWADPTGYLLRDLASIKLVEMLLKQSGCQYHFISMCNLETQLDQNDVSRTYDDDQSMSYKRICEMYRPQLDNIAPSFFTTLWNNNVYANKSVPDQMIYGRYFSDGHPTPKEHLKYLQETFDHKFTDETVAAVNLSNKNLIEFIREFSDSKNKLFAIYELADKDIDRLELLTTIVESLPIQYV